MAHPRPDLVRHHSEIERTDGYGRSSPHHRALRSQPLPHMAPFLSHLGVNQEIVPPTCRTSTLPRAFPGGGVGVRGRGQRPLRPATPRKKAVTVAAMGTYSETQCLPPKCRVDVIMSDSDEYRRRAGECLLFTQYVTSER